MRIKLAVCPLNGAAVGLSQTALFIILAAHAPSHAAHVSNHSAYYMISTAQPPNGAAVAPFCLTIASSHAAM